MPIEVESIDELEWALNAGAENMLIEDFSFEDMERVCAPNVDRVVLEVSGGVELS